MLQKDMRMLTDNVLGFVAGLERFQISRNQKASLGL